MRELSVTEQRYQAILAVIRDGRTVTEVASEWRVSRQTVHTWLSRYEAGGLDELGDRSHRPTSCPHQISGELEAMVLELLGRAHRGVARFLARRTEVPEHRRAALRARFWNRARRHGCSKIA
jgi:transposase